MNFSNPIFPSELSELRIATRQSPLALWQAELLKKYLETCYENLRIVLVPMLTEGDKILNKPLRDVGGKALFIKNIEEVLLEGGADLAVHSMKDVPADLDPRFEIAAVLPRENPLDAFVSLKYQSLDQLPEGAQIGTSSLRRQAQLLAWRPDLKIIACRGNVQTRLNLCEKLDGIILAASGLRRLGLDNRVTQLLPPDLMLSAAGQGAIGVEILSGDQFLKDLLKPINHKISECLIQAERAMCYGLEGSCHSPIGALAEFDGREFSLMGLVAKSDGSVILRAKNYHEDPEVLGALVAEELLSQGARKYLYE